MTGGGRQKGAHVSLLGWIIAAYSDYSSSVLCQREHNFRMPFSSSEEPNTASMTACLALIFEFIQKSVDHSVRSSRRYVTSTGCS